METKKYESGFQLIGTSIKEFSIKNSYYRMNSENSKNKSIKLGRRITELNSEDNKLYGLLEVTLEVYIADNDNINDDYDDADYNQYHISLKMEGAFSADSQISENDFKRMIDVNGCAAIYSIARAFIINTTAQTMLEGQIVLPLLNFFDIPSSNE